MAVMSLLDLARLELISEEEKAAFSILSLWDLRVSIVPSATPKDSSADLLESSSSLDCFSRALPLLSSF